MNIDDLTPEVREQLVQAAASGVTDRDAAIIGGVDPATLKFWLFDPEFKAEFDRAKAFARLRSIKVIQASDEWKAHAWLLEHVDPEHWKDGVESQDRDDEYELLQAELSAPVVDMTQRQTG